MVRWRERGCPALCSSYTEVPMAVERPNKRAECSIYWEASAACSISMNKGRRNVNQLPLHSQRVLPTTRFPAACDPCRPSPYYSYALLDCAIPYRPTSPGRLGRWTRLGSTRPLSGLARKATHQSLPPALEKGSKAAKPSSWLLVRTPSRSTRVRRLLLPGLSAGRLSYHRCCS